MRTDSSQFIRGKRSDGASDRTFEHIYAADGSTIGQTRCSSAEDVNQAVVSAQKAFGSWSRLKGVERGRILLKAAELLRARNSELARFEVLDTGKPLSEALSVDILSGADALEYYGGLAAGIDGSYVPLGNSFAYIKREPLGVCAGIGAWNYPMQIACWKAAPALAAGNTMVFKPAELTPVNAVHLAEVFMEAGLPEGVFNVVQGDAEIGRQLVRHSDIRKVSITGEVGTGKKVMADAAQTLKRVSLELGGKSPMLVFEDADLNEAVQGAMLANFYTQGEICSNGTRVYVHKQILDDFLHVLEKEARSLKIGDPMQEDTRIGALISREHKQKVMGYLALGKEQGAHLLFGGGEPDFGSGSPLNNGFFVEPAVFLSQTDTTAIATEEIFGPVMTVIPFENEQQVVQQANNTPYGLAAGVFTRDLARGHRVADQLEAGMCWINTYNVNPVEIPFGGVKWSGMGRENGKAALDDYTQHKTVYVEMDGMGRPFD